VNKQLNRLAVVAIVLLVVLIGASTYWQTWASAGLQDRQDNAIQRVVQFTIARGLIQSGKTTFATNTKVKRGGQTLYFRKYPQRGLAAQTIGYSTQSRSQAGLERSLNDYLTGSNTNLSDAFRHILDRLGSATIHGNNVQLTIRPRAQALAQQLLGNRCGAVVAMNPHTGAVYVMASSPTYDPNLIDKPGGYAKVLKIRGACTGASALYNRTTQGLYTP
jgi:penicillin-binding protein A